jgi:hypothetical protein
MPKRSRMPRDPNQRAKATLDLFLGEREPDPAPPAKDPMAVELGRRGGLIGGKARAAKLTAERRSEIARNAAAMRWRDRAAKD